MNKTTFAENLTNKRKELGLKQREMAKSLGVKIRRYQSWEEGRSEPCLNHCTLLCEILHVDDMYLFVKTEK